MTDEGGFELEDVGGDGVEEDGIVRNDEGNAVVVVREPVFEPDEGVEIEMVRGLSK